MTDTPTDATPDALPTRYAISGENIEISESPDGVAMRSEQVLPLLAALRAELAAVKLERDLVIAHDRQPYPTAEAYEKACAALNKARDQRDAALASLSEARAEAAALREQVRQNKEGSAILQDRLYRLAVEHRHQQMLWGEAGESEQSAYHAGLAHIAEGLDDRTPNAEVSGQAKETTDGQ